jgi:NAD(P)-dependent dehydrogenase (short-subunit alcohol dehydrogenase family)
VVGRSAAHVTEAAEAIRQAGGRAMAVTADVTDPGAVEHMVQQVELQLGPVSLLVNNAGITCSPGPIWETDPAEFRSVLDTNLYGAFLCARYLLPGMVERRRGRIINIASGAALAPITYGHSYCVSKAALLRLTECLAEDTREHGTRAFALNPGTVETDMTRYLIESEAGQTYLPWFGKFVREDHGDVPASLSANLVVRLASGVADQLTGCMVSVTDDLDTLIAQAEQIQSRGLYMLRLQSLTDSLVTHPASP